MEEFKLYGFSGDDGYNRFAYIIEGMEMYYFIREDGEGYEFDSVYPCPVAQVAGRFLHNWLVNQIASKNVPSELIVRIKKQQNNDRFISFCNDQKRQFGQKRLYL